MRLRLGLWGLFLLLQALVVAFPLDKLAPIVAGTIYLPLFPCRAVGLPVFGAAESGGWAAPSFFGWAVVAGFWAVLWWIVASSISHLFRRGSANS